MKKNCCNFSNTETESGCCSENVFQSIKEKCKTFSKNCCSEEQARKTGKSCC
jgi:hypothetical protein